MRDFIYKLHCRIVPWNAYSTIQDLHFRITIKCSSFHIRLGEIHLFRSSISPLQTQWKNILYFCFPNPFPLEPVWDMVSRLFTKKEGGSRNYHSNCDIFYRMRRNHYSCSFFNFFISRILRPQTYKTSNYPSREADALRSFQIGVCFVGFQTQGHKCWAWHVNITKDVPRWNRV